MTYKRTTILFLVLLISSSFLYYFGNYSRKNTLKLYWFIPDGLRADPETFKVFEWAQNGELPNTKKLMEQGSYGYSLPVFPGHTPTNFATLFTGSTPKIHGVADGPMRFEGNPLSIVSKSGFSSNAKKIPPIWHTLEQSGEKVTIISVPGSTPPEILKGNIIKGRWGGWGIDFPATIFQGLTKSQLEAKSHLANKLFFMGEELTKFIISTDPKNWKITFPNSYSPLREVAFKDKGSIIFGLVFDSKNDSKQDYDHILFSKDKKSILTTVKEGEWSEWVDLQLIKKISMNQQIGIKEKKMITKTKIRVIKLGNIDFIRVRFYYDALNSTVVHPSSRYEAIKHNVGPMVDFVDNFPPQLIYFSEDKRTFIEEANMSFDWHNKMSSYAIKNLNSDVVIHDIYTPNQMLTSRWWMGNIDPHSFSYKNIDEGKRSELWKEVKFMYKKIDEMVGTIIKNSDDSTYIVISSDHGVLPLYRMVRLNNLFARKGWLKFDFDKKRGVYTIDWKNTKVVYLKMNHIYINPNGLGDNYFRATGKAYNDLREEVISALYSLAHEGNQVTRLVVKWENAKKLDMPSDRVGDLIVANNPQYHWTEEVTSDLSIYKIPIISGYKQAIIPNKKTKGMWTPFIIKGPGIKKGYPMKNVVKHVDQYPTIMKLLNKKIPKFVEGKVINEIID